jgi:hypothetical protein
MFDLIERAEDYPKFLPWCAPPVLSAMTVVAAEITVDFHGVRFHLCDAQSQAETGSHGHRARAGSISPVRRRVAADATVDYGMQGRLRPAIRVRQSPGGPARRAVFDRITNTLVDAFVKQAQQVHGPTRDT